MAAKNPIVSTQRPIQPAYASMAAMAPMSAMPSMPGMPPMSAMPPPAFMPPPGFMSQNYPPGRDELCLFENLHRSGRSLLLKLSPCAPALSPPKECWHRLECFPLLPLLPQVRLSRCTLFRIPFSFVVVVVDDDNVFFSEN